MELEITEFLEIGTIVSPQGLKGNVKVQSDTDFPERFQKPGIRWITKPQQPSPQQIQLEKGWKIPGKNMFVVKFAGINDRQTAETLRGCKIFVLKSDKPQLEEGEYHVSDLIDLEVYIQATGESVGVVVDVFAAGNDILEVKLHKQPPQKERKIPDLSKLNRYSKLRKFRPRKTKPFTVLIPFVEEIVPVVDLENRRIEINPPLGLLNLDLAEEAR